MGQFRWADAIPGQFNSAMSETVSKRQPENESAETRLLDYLVSNQLLDAEGSERAKKVAAQSRVSLTKVLIELGLVPERDLLQAFERALGIETASQDEYPTDPLLPEDVTERFLREHSAILLGADDASLTVATSDPLNQFTLTALALSTSKRVKVKTATSSDIEQALARLFASDLSQTAMVQGPGSIGDASEADLARLRESASEAPIIRFVNTLISRAVEFGASDIHIEPLERRLRIRTRIDGVLKEEEPAPIDTAAAVLSRLKIMSGLNIAERRLPQDGAMKLAVKGREIDFRVATAPVAYGECAVVRILDKSSVPLDFTSLGFDGASRDKFDKLLERPNGIVLVTGPTGSGKTTSLYAALGQLNSVERKILSVEDPVEYKVPGVNQIQVKPEIGLTFAHILRSVLRHDPDVILVGEIRDAETAKIAVQAALTGHIVLSTVHTNSAAAAVTRLLDMGVEDYLLTSTISGIVSQRLVRVLCLSCKTSVEMQAEWGAEFKAHGLARESGLKCFKAVGCASCHGTGYKGRSVICEILTLSEDIRRLIANRASSSQIHAAALQQGMESLRRNGLRKVLEGTTTFEEVSRVAQEEG